MRDKRSLVLSDFVHLQRSISGRGRHSACFWIEVNQTSQFGKEIIHIREVDKSDSAFIDSWHHGQGKDHRQIFVSAVIHFINQKLPVAISSCKNFRLSHKIHGRSETAHVVAPIGDSAQKAGIEDNVVVTVGRPITPSCANKLLEAFDKTRSQPLARETLCNGQSQEYQSRGSVDHSETIASAIGSHFVLTQAGR